MYTVYHPRSLLDAVLYARYQTWFAQCEEEKSGSLNPGCGETRAPIGLTSNEKLLVNYVRQNHVFRDNTDSTQVHMIDVLPHRNH